MEQIRKNRKKSFFNKIFSGFVDMLKADMGILLGLAVICAIVAFSSEYFLTSKNIFNFLRQVSTTTIVACAMTMIIITGGIDLSCGAVIGLASVLSAGLITNNRLPIWLAVAMVLLVGVLVGTINGFILSRTVLPAFIVTYSLQSICQGASFIYTNAQTIRVAAPGFIEIGTGHLLGIPYPVIYMVLIIFISYLILNKTKMGRNMYAIGGNPKAAEFAGINIKGIKVFIYMLIGLVSAFAGIIMAARSYSGLPTAGQGFEMDVIAAVVLGGVSMAGGTGRISGTVIGALILAILNNGMNLMGISTFYQYIVKGVIILIAIYGDDLKRRGAKLI